MFMDNLRKSISFSQLIKDLLQIRADFGAGSYTQFSPRIRSVRATGRYQS